MLPFRRSVEADADRSSPWGKTHGEFCTGKMIPLGAKVIFKPVEFKREGPSKMGPTSLTVVSAGYELSSCCRWTGVYLGWSLDELAAVDSMYNGFYVVQATAETLSSFLKRVPFSAQIGV